MFLLLAQEKPHRASYLCSRWSLIHHNKHQMDKINNIPINNMSKTILWQDKKHSLPNYLVKRCAGWGCVQYVIQFIIIGAFIFFICLCAIFPSSIVHLAAAGFLPSDAIALPSSHHIWKCHLTMCVCCHIRDKTKPASLVRPSGPDPGSGEVFILWFWFRSNSNGNQMDLVCKHS